MQVLYLWPETSRIDHELIFSEIDMRDVNAVFWAPDLAVHAP